MRTIANLAPIVAIGRTEQAREKRVERNCEKGGSVMSWKEDEYGGTDESLRALL